MNITPYPQSFVETPIFADEWTLGGTSQFQGAILCPDRDWRTFTPPIEDQLRYGVETSACASFGTLNAVETLAKKQFNLDLNLSDRFLAKESGTIPYKGNSPHKVGETLRKKWSVSENLYPFVEEEYYKEIPQNLVTRAKKEGRQWDFSHEWVITNLTREEEKRNILEDTLKFSPIGVSVFAWAEENGVYVKAGVDNHWTLLVYMDDNYYYILDTYPPYLKKLERGYQFGYAKRYSLNKREVSWVNRIVNLFI